MRCSANKSCCSSDLSATIRIVGRCRVVPIVFVRFDERPHELCMNQFNFVTQLADGSRLGTLPSEILLLRVTGCWIFAPHRSKEKRAGPSYQFLQRADAYP
jgi:hypothetical protein